MFKKFMLNSDNLYKIYLYKIANYFKNLTSTYEEHNLEKDLSNNPIAWPRYLKNIVT